MSDECKDVLVEKNLDSLKFSSETSLFLRSLLTSERYRAAQTKANGKYKVLEADYADFKSEHEKDLKYYSLDVTENQALSALTMHSLPGAVGAWAGCMKTRSRDRLFCWLQGSSEEVAIALWIEWWPPLGSSGSPLRDFKISMQSSGGVPPTIEPKPRPSLNEGRHAFIIRRPGNDVAITGVINGALQGKAAYAFDFYIPKHLPPRAIPQTFLAQNPHLLIRQENIHGGLQFGRVYFRRDGSVPMSGTDYRGVCLGMHAPFEYAFADFQIPTGAKFFHSDVGLVQDDASPVDFSVSSAVAYVEFDNDRQWQTELNGTQTFVRGPELKIPEGTRLLRLAVHGKGANWCDHTTWANPRFYS